MAKQIFRKIFGADGALLGVLLAPIFGSSFTRFFIANLNYRRRGWKSTFKKWSMTPAAQFFEICGVWLKYRGFGSRFGHLQRGEIWLSTRPKYFMRFQLFSEIGAKITNSTSPQMHVWTKNGVLQAWPSDLVVLCTQCLKIMISSLGRSALLSHHSHLHPIHMRLRLHHWVLLLRLRDLL